MLTESVIKRLLVVADGTIFSGAVVKWAVEIARRHRSEITALPLFGEEHWKASLPAMMTTGDAARLLEFRPWEVASRRSRRVLSELEQACAEGGVLFHLSRAEGNLLDAIISLWRYHDLVVFGLRGLFDDDGVSDPERAIIRLIKSGVRPIFAVSREFRPIRRVLIAYSGSLESAKTMKQFVQMGLWPDAELEVACFGQESASAGPLLEDADAYCRAHGLNPGTTSLEGSASRRLLSYAGESNVDLIVIGDGYRNIVKNNSLGETFSHATRHSELPLFLSH